MSVKQKYIPNYVDLIKLKVDKLMQSRKLSIILNDDVWDKGTLIVKSGGYLTEELINKLINFGIKKVNVNFVEQSEEKPSESAIYRPVLKDFVKNQNVLIVDKNVLNTAWFVRNLVDMGFNQGNVFVTSDINSINQYFRAMSIDFLFVGFSLYENCPKCVNKYSMLKSTQVFVIMESKDSLRKMKTDYSSNIKFLRKPLGTKAFNVLVNKSLSANLVEYYTEEASVS